MTLTNNKLNKLELTRKQANSIVRDIVDASFEEYNEQELKMNLGRDERIMGVAKSIISEGQEVLVLVASDKVKDKFDPYK